jgi:hypothetical protein
MFSPEYRIRLLVQRKLYEVNSGPKERSLDIGFKQREEGKEQQQFAKTPTAEQRAQLEQLAIRNQCWFTLNLFATIHSRFTIVKNHRNFLKIENFEIIEIL